MNDETLKQVIRKVNDAGDKDILQRVIEQIPAMLEYLEVMHSNGSGSKEAGKILKAIYGD